MGKILPHFLLLLQSNPSLGRKKKGSFPPLSRSCAHQLLLLTLLLHTYIQYPPPRISFAVSQSLSFFLYILFRRRNKSPLWPQHTVHQSVWECCVCWSSSSSPPKERTGEKRRRLKIEPSALHTTLFSLITAIDSVNTHIRRLSLHTHNTYIADKWARTQCSQVLSERVRCAYRHRNTLQKKW